MEEIIFKSQEELYQRILPALRSKKKMLRKSGLKTINESDIWDCMRYNVWADSYGLELCDMVEDILHTDNLIIMEYFHNKYMPNSTVVEDDFELPKLKSSSEE